MKRWIIGLMVLGLLATSNNAQEVEKKDTRPVRAMFESGLLIDQQTCYIPAQKTLEFVIEHRFGKINNGISDLYGIYAPSNIRLGLNYSLHQNLLIGIGTTKDRKLQDLRWKWNILQQTRSNSFPVTISYYGNLSIDGRDEKLFGKDFAFSNRLGYFTQLIVSRKVNHWLSVQIASGFAHVNIVPAALTGDKGPGGYEHDMVGLAFGGRARFSPQSSVLFHYESPLKIDAIKEQGNYDTHPQPNFSLGWEISTSTHVFQLFVGTANTLSPTYNLLENRNEWLNGDLVLGFNITRLWSF